MSHAFKKALSATFNFVFNACCGWSFRVLYRKYCKVSGNVGFKVFPPTVVSCYF